MQKTWKQPACCIFLLAICFALRCEGGEGRAESVNCAAAVGSMARPKIIFHLGTITSCLREVALQIPSGRLCLCLNSEFPTGTSRAAILATFATAMELWKWQNAVPKTWEISKKFDR